MKRIITVHCIAAPGKSAELIALGTGMIAPSCAEDGCIHYSFYQDLNAPDRFFFYEEWRDQNAIDRHNASPHFLAFQPRFRPLLAADPVISVMSAE